FQHEVGTLFGVAQKVCWTRGSDNGIPSWNRRGGCAIPKMVPFLIGADGVVISDEMFRDAFPTRVSRTDHPVRANFGGLRHHLLDGAATPPLQGGEYVLVQHSFHTPCPAR